jgi:hypothetical protein
MSRPAGDIHHEAQYWLQILLDVQEINGAVGEASSAVMDTATELLQLVFVPEAGPILDKLTASSRASLDALAKIQRHLDGLLEMTKGRQLVLEREVEELPDDDERR